MKKRGGMMKKKRNNSYYHYFPPELITDILSWLPVKSLLRFKCVSKTWYNLSTDLSFIKLHLDRSLKIYSNTALVLESFQPNRNVFSFHVNHEHPYYSFFHLCDSKGNKLSQCGRILSSCNGLLCFSRNSQSPPPRSSGLDLTLYNPATRALKVLPSFYFNKGAMMEFVDVTWIVALGYDCVSDDYKLLRLWNDPKREIFLGNNRSFLYSLKRDAWEIIEEPPWDIRSLDTSCTVMVNNSFHWLSLSYREIRCFDLVTKKYHVMPLPKRISANSPKLTAFDGKLCIVTFFLDIWILNKYGDKKSWTQLFRNQSWLWTIGDTKYIWWSYNPNIACLKGKDWRTIIIFIRSTGLRKDVWICCDLEYGGAKKIEMLGYLPINLWLTTPHPWMESLVPLN